MDYKFHQVRSFEIAADYVLSVGFEDGTTTTIDFRPVLRGEIYSPLTDLNLFNRVRIDPEVKTLVWPNGADFNPNVLYDWPNRIVPMTRAAETWELTTVK